MRFLLQFNLCLQYDSFLTVVRCERKKTKWRRGGAKKDTKWRHTEQWRCALSIIIYFLPMVHFSMLLWGANQRRRSCDMRNEGVHFLLLNILFSFSLLLRYKRRRRSDGMWSNESMNFLLLLFNCASPVVFFLSNYNIQFAYSSFQQCPCWAMNTPTVFIGSIA